MPLDIVLGTQWGDEGKGRIVDLLAAGAHIVARYSGGDNAGHTVTIGDDIFRLHLVPSGIIHPDVTCVIGNGVVVNPAVLLREMDSLAAKGVDVSPDHLKLSKQAHLITPAHIALDGAQERRRGQEAIGTTLRGIGPAYRDKAARKGLRAQRFAEPETLADAVHEHVASVMSCWTLRRAAARRRNHCRRIRRLRPALAPYLVESTPFLNKALEEGQTVLAEGRAPSSTWTTAPTRSSPAAIPPPGAR